MQGRALDESTLALALTALEQDLATAGGGESSHFGSPGFRVQLMRALLYKFFLVAQGDPLPPRLASAVSMEERPASKASQTYTPDASLSPVSQPVPKVDGLLQTTGEAVYVDDEVCERKQREGEGGLWVERMNGLEGREAGRAGGRSRGVALHAWFD